MDTLRTRLSLVRKVLDEDKFACGVFIDLQKVFDTVDHGEPPINGLKVKSAGNKI